MGSDFLPFKASFHLRGPAVIDGSFQASAFQNLEASEKDRFYSSYSIIGFLGRKAFRREVSNLAGTKNEPLKKNQVFYFNYHVIIASMLASL